MQQNCLSESKIHQAELKRLKNVNKGADNDTEHENKNERDKDGEE